MVSDSEPDPSRDVYYDDPDGHDDPYQDHTGNGLILEDAPYGLERIYDYEAGGHHPVHLGDMLDQRYKVIHKLGSGGFANVWFCRDVAAERASSNKYVAVKIIMADNSTGECPELRVSKLAELAATTATPTDLWCSPLAQFDIEGPNGKHFAFVYPILGPRVSRLISFATPPNEPGEPLRKIAYQTTRAMARLHSIKLCHGDFRPANILVQISGLGNLSEDEVMELIGKPTTNRVIDGATQEAHDLPLAPKYLVRPINWDKVMTSGPQGAGLIKDPKASVIDFGECYETSEPPDTLGIPVAYCSPEYLFDNTISAGDDVWALGCTLFEIRTGRKLFNTFDDDPDEGLVAMAEILGRFPEPWWSGWEARGEYFKDLNEDGTDRVGGRLAFASGHRLGDGAAHSQGEREHVVHFERPVPRSLVDCVREGLFYEDPDRPGGLERDISEKEVVVFADLLAKVLKFSPGERLSPAQVLEHEWFRFMEG